MDVWNSSELEVRPGHPEVLHSSPKGRAIAIRLDAGTGLGDHEVHEDAWLTVAEGRVTVAANGGRAEVPAGGLVAFDPRERHEVTAVEDSLLLLLLTPWPAPDRR